MIGTVFLGPSWGGVRIFFINGRSFFQQERVLCGWLAGPSPKSYFLLWIFFRNRWENARHILYKFNNVAFMSLLLGTTGEGSSNHKLYCRHKCYWANSLTIKDTKGCLILQQSCNKQNFLSAFSILGLMFLQKKHVNFDASFFSIKLGKSPIPTRCFISLSEYFPVFIHDSYMIKMVIR